MGMGVGGRGISALCATACPSQGYGETALASEHYLRFSVGRSVPSLHHSKIHRLLGLLRNGRGRRLLR